MSLISALISWLLHSCDPLRKVDFQGCVWDFAVHSFGSCLTIMSPCVQALCCIFLTPRVWWVCHLCRLILCSGGHKDLSWQPDFDSYALVGFGLLYNEDLVLFHFLF